MSATDTIFALATPYGKSGVAIIRISGTASTGALSTLCSKNDFTPNLAFTASFRDASGNVIDHGLAVYFKAPKSFTGEDTVELHLHGSLAAIRHMLSTLADMGLRPAEAGEFTRRAFLNGKMDLTQAEGMADLIDAESQAQKTQAMRQMQGALSGYYNELRERIIRILAHLEATIDFPDEDIPQSVVTGLAGEVREAGAVIEAALADSHRGERLREGFRVAILGAPNAGKSSLLNAMAGREAAIVSHRAGTTRDVIEIHMDIGGFPVMLLDTAGLRESADDIEEEGVRRALKQAQAADLRLVLFDGTSWPQLDPSSQALIDKDTIIVVTKEDLTKRSNNKLSIDNNILYVSSRTGQGVGELISAIGHFIANRLVSTEFSVITRARHRALLEGALGSLRRYSPDAPLEIGCEELRRAALAVGKITGKIQVDDVLDVIFRQFCIGK